MLQFIEKRLALFMFGALVPIIALGLLFPERIWQSQTGTDSAYIPNPGAPIVAYVEENCPHCHDFKEFAEQQSWPVDYREVSTIAAQQQFTALQEVAPSLNPGVPTIIIDGNIYQGYETDETSGKNLAEVFDGCQASTGGCLQYADFMATAQNVTVQSSGSTCTDDCELDEGKYTINTGLFGEVNLLDYSLVGLSVLLGFLDGFNPCAMWVLITLLTLLINTHDKKKIWVVGGTFLLVSGAVYYFFIAAWLNVFLLIGYNTVIQLIIGIVAVLGGGFYLYEAFGKNPNECKVTNLSQRQRTIAKMRHVLEISQWPLMILGVTILAISVNMIELVCTAGLPAIFTQILAFNDVSDAARYGYIGVYILLYMIDDLVIFAIAIATLHATGLTTKYRRFTLIFGGVLMYSLGLLLIFAPELLTF